jgi:hypothetical protein
MAGRGPPPKDPSTRVRRGGATRGEWDTRAEVGWRHGRVPAAPAKLLKVSRDVWAVWFGSWFAAHWEPEDLPGLYLVIRLYDAVMRGELQRSAELRIQMDTYGMTPKGQQDRRWRRPPAGEEAPSTATARGRAAQSRYGHLRPVQPEPAKPAKPARKRAARPRKAAGAQET